MFFLKIILFIYLIIFTCSTAKRHSTKDLLFFILNQNSEYDNYLTKTFYQHFDNQFINNTSKPIVKELKDHDHIGGWKIYPLFPELDILMETNNVTWVIFSQVHTRFNLNKLLELLNNQKNIPLWIGHGLKDKETTIIHHFDNDNLFHYPNIASGFAFNLLLIKNLNKLFNKNNFQNDFSIDASYELAKMLWNKGHGFSLEHNEQFCIDFHQNCVSYVDFTDPKIDFKLKLEDVFFAVKTCKKFHESRLSVIENTWGQFVEPVYFSDATDHNYSTINLKIPNVEKGHCKKTHTILNFIFQQRKKYKWVVIADDDTLISVSELMNFLNKFNPNRLYAIGERYGYNLDNYIGGYNYITGGGGIVLSYGVLEKILFNCICSSIPTTPDDMYLMGVCLKQLKIDIIHSPKFHQARPNDYAPNYLKSYWPISFHKFWGINPLNIYKLWFLDNDQKYMSYIQRKPKSEL